jgi:enterochelin esterase family protein
MDNLIAEKKAKPMIVVMDNLNAVKPGESAALYFARGALTQAVPEPPPPAGTADAGRAAAARAGGAVAGQRCFTDMMLTDLIPMVERTFSVAPGRENRRWRAVHGRRADLRHALWRNLDKFAYIGGFSGSSGGRGGFDPKTSTTACSPTPRLQQEGEGPVPGHRIDGRAWNEDVQRAAAPGRHQQRLL